MAIERRGTKAGRVAFLESLNSMLDELVKRRTLDLVATNERLIQEIATRKRAERELELSRSELRALAEQVSRAQDEAWAQIARQFAEEIVGAVREAARGQRYDANAIAAALSVREARRAAGVRPLHESLSSKEFQVFMLIVAGTPLKEIAVRMSVARTTVASYRARVLEKMKMSRNSELVRYALKNGLLA